MKFERAFIPVGGAWSTPFCRWQGALSEISSLDLAASTAASALEERGVRPEDLDQIVLGSTIPQAGGFYGGPTVAAKLGAPEVTGPIVSQACATSAASVALAAAQTESDGDGLTLALLTDRTSNSPHVVYPSARSMGGAPLSEDWLLEAFKRDPWAGEAMIQTAENVAAEGGFAREQIDEVTLLRHEQYAAALADDRAFQRRYMVPVEIPGRKGKVEIVDSDQGVHETTAAGLAALEPTLEGGTTTAGSQTHPADGSAGVLVTSEARAREIGRDGAAVRILGSGTSRVGKALMPKAPVPAARRALEAAGVAIDDVDVITTHTPFAVNDLWFSREMGVEIGQLNPFGCSLVYGHPNAPTGARALSELIEALALRGGGLGLFTGCAAGDTGAALVVRLDG
ncbi:MAG: thiolase family protein [Solirubrobacterales bacterium]